MLWAETSVLHNIYNIANNIACTWVTQHIVPIDAYRLYPNFVIWTVPPPAPSLLTPKLFSKSRWMPNLGSLKKKIFFFVAEMSFNSNIKETNALSYLNILLFFHFCFIVELIIEKVLIRCFFLISKKKEFFFLAN